MTYLLYDGACPFCSSLSEFYQLKARLPNLKIISMRDGKALRQVKLPAHFDLNKGMIIILENGEILQGEPAFRLVNAAVKVSGLWDRFVLALNSWAPLTFFVYPLLKLGRLIVLFFKGIPSHLARIDIAIQGSSKQSS
jgi:predicted DCC family thiol-disulfide oxidoreductase YuxK